MRLRGADYGHGQPARSLLRRYAVRHSQEAGGSPPLAVLLLSWSAPAQPAEKRLAVAYGRLPLIFEANAGQIDPQVKFLSRKR